MELSKIIKQGESENVEFKESFDKKAIITIGAMASRKGGTVVIGVTNIGVVKGIQIGKETLQQWSNEIGQITEPRLIPNMSVQTIDDKTIVGIHITEYPIKPVSVQGRCYLRIDNSNKQLNAKEISDLHLQSLNLSWDSYPATDKTLKDIDLKRVEEYVKEVNQKGRRALTGTPLHILQKLELVKDNKPTWACLLLFRKNPYGSPYSTVRVARFKGDVSIIDDNVIEGSILDQVDTAIKAIMKNISVRYNIKGKIKREEVWDYPLEAIREGVFNAICHRDYHDSADTQIKIYDDRIFIWNPGKLPNGLSVEDLLSNQYVSQPRNRLITQAFYDMGNIERLGSGIERIMKACKEAGSPKPEFKEQSGGFAVTFKKANLKSGGDEYSSFTEEVNYLTNEEIKILKYCGKPKNKRDILTKIGMSYHHKTFERYVNPLMDKGYITLTLPDTPKSPKQKYKTTHKGEEALISSIPPF